MKKLLVYVLKKVMITPTKYMDEGLMMAGKGELQKAALLFCRAIQKDPCNPDAYQRLGEVLVPLENKA